MKFLPLLFFVLMQSACFKNDPEIISQEVLPEDAYSHVCGLLESNDVSCWPKISKAAIPASWDTQALEISMGMLHTCVINQDAKLVCAGDNSHKQGKVPDELRDIKFNFIGAGGFHTCASTYESEQLKCWGDNSKGQLNIPSALSGKSYLEISAGKSHTCVRTVEKKIICFGDNTFKQSQVPDELKDEKFSEVSAGGFFTCAVKENGDGVCFGVIDAPPSDKKFISISSGLTHACGIVETPRLSNEKNVVCWGDNTFKHTPVPPWIIAKKFPSSLISRFGFSCITTEENKVHCWGNRSPNVLPTEKIAQLGN